MVMMVMMVMMVVMAVDWTVIGSHRLLHEDVPGSGSLGGAGERVPAGVHAVVALGAAGTAPVNTPATAEVRADGAWKGQLYSGLDT